MTADILMIVAGALTSLMAGLYFAFSCAVNPGLRRLKDAEYLKAMQSVNVAILNPVFLTTFWGSLVLLLLTTFLQKESPGFAFLLAASIVYFFGQFVVTVVGNIPLNKKLEKFGIASASEFEIAAMRNAFEKPWNRWNAVRTVASTITVILILVACINH